MMKIQPTLLFGLCICLILYLHSSAIAAETVRPIVVLDSDPRTHMVCNTDAVIVTAAVAMPYQSGGDVFLYQAGLNVVKQMGSLQKRQLGLLGQNAAQASIVWDAADLIVTDDREIYTSRINQDGSLATIPFLWESLSAKQKAYLNTSATTHIDDQLGQDRLDFLRGSRQRETTMAGGIFRSRASLLGMIVNSAPVLLGAPMAGISGDGYLDFMSTHSKRSHVVFVGANDGALHAFNTDSGRELFAYIPDFLFAKLSALTDPNASYRPSVDGLIAVAEARVELQWKTVLMAGMGGGAQGVFALDVSDAEQFDKGGGALWEFSDADDADIGNVVAAPLIAKFKVQTKGGNPIYRYFAVIADGLNNYDPGDAHKADANASNSVFLLALDKKKSEPWIEGNNYYKLILPSGIANMANGLTGVTPVLDNAGAVHYLYVVDLQGNLWRIDFERDAPWNRTSTKPQSKLVFSAKDERGNRQPITQAPVVVFAPGGYLILFGTGKYMERADVEQSGFKTQSFYGILDSLKEADSTISRRQLLQRTLSSASVNDQLLKISSTASDAALHGESKGWYVDFMASDQTGERSISAVSVVEGKLFFNTLIPATNSTSVSTNSICAVNHSRAYSLNVFNGLPLNARLAGDDNLTGQLSDTGFWPPLIVLENTLRNNNEPTTTKKKRQGGKIIRLKPDGAEIEGAIGDATTTQNMPIEGMEIGGQLSWHEIINWHELHQNRRGQ